MRPLCHLVFCFFLFYVPYSPATAGAAGELDIIFGDDVPKWLVESIRTEVRRSEAYYGTHLVKSNWQDVTVTVSFSKESPFVRGHVHSINLMSLHIGGEKWLVPNQDRQKVLELLIRHEMFHIWFLHHFDPVNLAQLDWVEEGAAVYYSIQQRPLEAQDKAAVRWLNGCISGLGERNVDQLSVFGNSTAKYACGPFLFWFIDQVMALNEGSDGTSAFLRALSDGFALGRGSGQTFHELFIKTLVILDGHQDIFTLLDQILNAQGLDRWQTLNQLLVRHDAGLVMMQPADFNAEDIFEATLQPTLQRFCRQQIYKQRKPGKEIFVPCNLLGRGFEEDHLNGIDMNAEPLRAYLKAKGICAAKGNMEFRKGSGHGAGFRVPCKNGLPPLPTRFHLVTDASSTGG